MAQGCSPLKNMKKLYIGIGISLLFLILANTGNNISSTGAAPSGNQNTLTEVFPDDNEVYTFDSIFFTIHVTANGNPVPSGLVTVREETDSFYSVTGNISNGIAVIEWIAQPWNPTGWCTIIADYAGTTGYNASQGTTQVNVANPEVPGEWETQTTITPSTVNVYPNDTINFEVVIDILGGAFPLFSGGYITIVDVTENIVLSRHDIGMEVGISYSVIMPFTIPSWYAYGWHTIEARYSGSNDADHAASSGNCTIQTLINGYTIQMTGSINSLNREADSIQINATIAGDDPTGKILRLHSYQQNGSIQTLLDVTTATSREYAHTFDARYYHLVGPIIFELTLEDANTSIIEASANISATIYDTISFNYQFNASVYSGGDTVGLTIYSVETDVPTQPVTGVITVKDLNLGIELNQTTDISGRTDFSWKIPIDAAGSAHNIEISMIPDNNVYPPAITTTSIDVRGDIQFIVDYPTNVQRGDQITLICTILGPNSTLVTEGTITLKYQSGGIIWTGQMTGTVQYTYDFALSHDLGSTDLAWEFSGTPIFEQNTFLFSINVFSEPHFNTLTLNRTTAIEGKPVLISGTLLDEIGLGISGEDIDLYDNSNYITTVTTNIDGTFTYEYIIPNGATLGVHVIESQYTGNYANYRLAASNIGTASLTIKPPIQLSVSGTLIGTEITAINIAGGAYEQVDIAWSDLNNPSVWHSIASIVLDQNGDGTYDWTVPVFKGQISIRAKNQDNDMTFVEDSIYMRAQVTMNNVPSEVQVQESFTIEIQSNEEFRVLLDGNVQLAWRNNGTILLPLNLATRGVHTVTVETRGNYVIEETFTSNIVAIESLTGSMNLPASISSTSTVNADIIIEGIHEGPINGLSVKMLVNGTLRATGTTNINGQVILTCSLLPGTYNITVFTEGSADYYQDIQFTQVLIVQSGSQLQFPATINMSYYNVSTLSVTLVDDELNPVLGEEIEFLLSDDQGVNWFSLGLGTTDSSGIAEYDWFVNLNPGNYILKAEYAGSSYYDPSLITKAVTIDQNELAIIWNGPSGSYGTIIPLNANITTISGYNLDASINLTVSIYYEDQWNILGTSQTDVNGFMVLLIDLNFNPGTYPIQIEFSGNNYYYAGTWQKTVTINQIQTIISLDQSTYDTTYGTIQSIPVYITSASGDPITDGQMDFYVLNGNDTLLYLTGTIASGTVIFEVPIEAIGEGNYQLHLEWSGNITQAPATHTAVMNVAKGNAQLEPTITSGVIEYGSTTTWFVYVKNGLGNPISGIPVNFATSLTGINWDDWGTILTNESGYASITVTWTTENQVHYGRPGTYTIRISIEENDKVITTQTTRMLTVTKQNVILTLEDTSGYHLGGVMIEGNLTTSTGDPIANVVITVYWNATATNDWEQIGILSTDANGYFSIEPMLFVPPNSYGIRVEYAGDMFHVSASQNAILEVLDNPSELKNYDISPTVLDLGDLITIQANVTDIDSVSSVTAIIYSTNNSFTITLDYVNNSYEKTIWCDAQYTVGNWTVNLVVTDNLGIQTTFTNVGQFEISSNPAPEASYTLNSNSLPDGSTFEFEITASDTLGIKSVKVEIDGTIYDITQSNSSLVINGQLSMDIDGDQNWSAIYNIMRAREQAVFYFNYIPQTTGNLPFSIYIEDNAGQIKTISGNIMVEAKAPELSVHSITSLNGTAPYPFSLILNATDGSGINIIRLYANNQEYILQYNATDNNWQVYVLFNTGTYALSIIAEDNVGVQATLDLGTLTIANPGITLSSTENSLGDTLSIDITNLNPEVIVKANLTIYSSEYTHQIVIDSINTDMTKDLYLNENFPLAAYSITLTVELSDGTTVEFQDIASFTIFTNSMPVLEVNFLNQNLFDGEATNYTIKATDSLGIDSIVIIRSNETITLTFDANGTATGSLRFYEAGTYLIQVTATDKADAQVTKNYLFTVNAKGPEFESVYPSIAMLDTLNTPFTLELETVVTDASGVDTVVLYLNDTPYTLTNDFGVWHVTVDLESSTYTLKLVATDIYGTETEYILGTVEPKDNGSSTSEPPGSNGSNSPETPKNNIAIDPTVAIAVLTIITVIGSAFMSWKKKN